MSDGPTESEIAEFRRLGAELAVGVIAALPGWVDRSVGRIVEAWGDAVGRDVVESAGAAAAAEIGPRLRDLLARDADDQWTNPLAVIREATRFPTEVLESAGVPPVVRDASAEAHFPDDLYDLTPGGFADLDPDLHDLGIRWGAAKAYLHLRSRAGPDP